MAGGMSSTVRTGALDGGSASLIFSLKRALATQEVDGGAGQAAEVLQVLDLAAQLMLEDIILRNPTQCSASAAWEVVPRIVSIMCLACLVVRLRLHLATVICVSGVFARRGVM